MPKFSNSGMAVTMVDEHLGYIYIYIYLSHGVKDSSHFLVNQKQVKTKHDWTQIKHLNVLHHNRTQKELLKSQVLFS